MRCWCSSGNCTCDVEAAWPQGPQLPLQQAEGHVQVVSRPHSSPGGGHRLLEVGQEFHGAGRAAAKPLLDAAWGREG